VTGLVWQKTTNAATTTWQAALDYCTGPGAGWSLPTRIELTSIIDNTQAGAKSDPLFKYGNKARFTWASTPWVVESSFKLGSPQRHTRHRALRTLKVSAYSAIGWMVTDCGAARQSLRRPSAKAKSTRSPVPTTLRISAHDAKGPVARSRATASATPRHCVSDAIERTNCTMLCWLAALKALKALREAAP